MRILPIKGGGNVYTSNVYLILGDWKRVVDVPTLIDVGNDPGIIDVLENINTGLGKDKVEQVVLTHGHYDHAGILPLIKKRFHPRVCAFSRFVEGVDHVLVNGERIQVGDAEFEVIHTPGHTDDSICLVNEAAGVLFSGDIPFPIRTPGFFYQDGFSQALEQLCRKSIEVVFAGHGEPVDRDVRALLRESLKNVRNSATTRPSQMIASDGC